MAIDRGQGLNTSTATALSYKLDSFFDEVDGFYDTYLGSKTSDPSVDNDGDFLNTGTLYFNSTSNSLRVFNGSSWVSVATLQNTSTVAVTNDSVTDGTNTFTTPSTSDVLSLLSGQLTESQLYSDLSTRIDLIDGTSSLAGSVANRVATETTDRVAAVNALDTRVTTTESGITDQGVDITSLQSTVSGHTTDIGGNTTNITGNATALTALTSRVTTTEGDITSQAGTLTTVQADLASITGVSAYDATTSYSTGDYANYSGNLYQATSSTTGNLPTDTTYWSLIGNYSSLGELVSANSSAVSALDVRVTASEGDITSHASSLTGLQSSVSTNASGITSEASTRASADTALASDITTLQSDVGTNTAAIQTESTARANADTSLASDVTTLQTTTGGHTTSIQTHASSINGIEGKHTVKIDNNGYVSGYGLISTANNGTPTSEFTIVADKFSIAPVATSSSAADGSPFFHISSPQTINGVTVAAGTYMKSANIHDASITTAKIKDLAVDTAKIDDAAITNAKINDLNADKITAGIISADRIDANSITASKLVIGGTGGLSTTTIGAATTTDLNTTNTNVSTAQSTANTANSTANTAVTNAATAQTTADDIESNIYVAGTTSLDGGNITTTNLRVQNVGPISPSSGDFYIKAAPASNEVNIYGATMTANVFESSYVLGGTDMVSAYTSAPSGYTDSVTVQGVHYLLCDPIINSAEATGTSSVNLNISEYDANVSRTRRVSKPSSDVKVFATGAAPFYTTFRSIEDVYSDQVKEDLITFNINGSTYYYRTKVIVKVHSHTWNDHGVIQVGVGDTSSAPSFNMIDVHYSSSASTVASNTIDYGTFSIVTVAVANFDSNGDFVNVSVYAYLQGYIDGINSNPRIARTNITDNSYSTSYGFFEGYFKVYN